MMHMNRKKRDYRSYPYICVECRTKKTGARYLHPSKPRKNTDKYGFYVCFECKEKIQNKLNEDARTEQRLKIIESTDKFSDSLASCEKNGTCDILHAHHECLIDDPDRLRTDFMINLICGDEKLEKYRNKFNPSMDA